MKYFYKIITLTLTLAFCVSLSAQNTIGYSNGYGKRNNGVRFGSGTKQGMAIKLSKEKAAMLKGSSLVGIHTMFGTSQISDLEIFVTRSLEEEPIYKEIFNKGTTSWKDYKFSQPVTLGDEEVYVGYTLNVVAESYRPLIFDESVDFGGELFWVYNNGVWQDVTEKGYGAANIQLLIDGAPTMADLIMKPINISGFYKAGEGCAFDGQIFNFGNQTIKAFDISYQVGDEQPSVHKIENANLEPNSTYDFSLPKYVSEKVGKLPIKLSVAPADNSIAETDASDNVSNTFIYIYPTDVEKKVLIESFTGMTCSNCPTGKTFIKNAISGREQNFVEVAHHAGYYEDAFSMIEDWEYTYFYNGQGLYAPAVMFNRAIFSGSPSAPVFESTDNAKVIAASKAFDTVEPYVSIKTNSAFNPTTRECKVTVSVHTFVKPDVETNCLNVFLTQDNMVGYQAGAGSTYSHEHVFRQSLTGTWGTAIELVEGETVTKEFVFTLADAIAPTYSTCAKDWNGAIDWTVIPEKMNVVAFVSAFSTTATDWFVYNCNTTPLYTPAPAGIEGPLATASSTHLSVHNGEVIVTGEDANLYIYNSAGALVKQVSAGTQRFTLPRGFYVVRISSEQGKAHACKLLVK